MSRVDEAARRAATNPAPPGATPVPVSADSGLDAEALGEQFFASQPLDALELAKQFLEEPAETGGGIPSGDGRRPEGTAAGALVSASARIAPAATRPADAPARVAPASPAALGPTGDAKPRSSLFERMSDHVAQKIVVDKGLQASSREQYRRLAATLHHGQMMHGLKVVTVTSALPGEGKTLTSANLAMTLSESYRRRVLLIDADLRRPTLHSVFNIDNSSGLCEGLAAVDDQPMPLRQVSSHLSILPAGHPNSDPMAGLISERFQRLILEARGTFDWVIIDTPPVALLTDSRLLASLADGVMLVVRAESTSHTLVKKASESLGRERILGVVLNGALIGPRTAGHSYYGGYYYGGHAPAPRPSWRARLTGSLTSRFARRRRETPAEPAQSSTPGTDGPVATDTAIDG